MKNAIFMGIAFFLLSGCAVQKPLLADDQYTAFATQLMSIQKCVADGIMTPEIGARGQQYSMANLNTWQFDRTYFLNRAKQIESSVKPSQADCNTMAMNIVQVKNQIDAQNDQAQRDAEAWQNMQNTLNQNKTTYCNKIGTQTICNTY